MKNNEYKMKRLCSSLEAYWLGFQGSTAMAQVQSRAEELRSCKPKRKEGTKRGRKFVVIVHFVVSVWWLSHV